MIPAVYLKSLSLRGFKSFADPTTLEFEPGVTVIVGPNGSGKSNVVDAVAWVLGAQGPRVVRSSKMDDVIFAGTSKRPALGRAEVTLTIDNSSRRLPVDLAEVTITRTLFRTGESEYSMNGASCRLLDIQEMLSDAGVGRQQHVIMSQGQLAGVLDARPEDRRAVIEEAAGVLKFRRRRERSERRLESTEANLLRLQDLLREVRRQLRPLERQAEAARRHGSLVGELQALRLFVAGRDLDSLQKRSEENEQRKAAFAGDEERLKAALARLDELVATSEAAMSAEQASDVVSALSSAERLHERARGVANVIAERRLRVDAALTATTETDVISSLEAESSRLERDLAATMEAAQLLEPEWQEVSRRAEALRVDEAQFAAAFQQEAPRSEATGDRRRSRDEAANQLSRAREALARANERAAAIERQRTELSQRSEVLERGAAQLGETLARLRDAQVAAENDERAAADEVTVAERAARDAVERSQKLDARAEALRGALDEAHARAGVEQLAGRPGVLGTLLDIVEVDAGYERAFEAAVQEALGTVVVDGRQQARNAVEHLHELELSGAVLPIDTGREAASSFGPDSLRARVRGTQPGAEALLDALLADVVLCSTGIRDALDLAGRSSAETVVVTVEGDRLSSRGWRLGAGRAGATRAALESVQADSVEADADAAEARGRAESARQAWSAARLAAAEASEAAAAAAAEERQTVAQRDETGRRLLQLGSEGEQIDAAQAEAASLAERLEAELASLEAELGAAEKAEADARVVETEVAQARRLLDERARELASLQADLEVRSAAMDERRALLTERRTEVERRLAGCEAAREGAAERRQAHEAISASLARIGSAVTALLEELALLLVTLREERRQHDEAVGAIAQRLTATRANRVAAERDLAATREQAQRNELERAELRVRLETALETIRHDLD
ncbi:MAG: AAA family ATPase, partial [Acidimicrobiales bacterium]